MIRICVVGAGGRMGQHVVRAVEADAELELVAALEYAQHPELGQPVAGGIALSADMAAGLEAADVAIDFSTPDSTAAAVRAAPAAKTALVIATTGMSDEQSAAVRTAAQSVPIVLAANFSLGITTLIGLVEEAVRKLPGYEIEVLEMHHNRKVDAPSGTALRLAEAAAAARGDRLANVARYHREGLTGARTPEEIGMQTLRGGDVVGEHTVFVVGPGERLELTHRALSRDNFAAGAVRAAHWAAAQPPGLYSMTHVLAG